MYIPSLVTFGVCSGTEKCNHLGRKVVMRESIGTLQVETCSGPNYENDHFPVQMKKSTGICLTVNGK